MTNVGKPRVVAFLADLQKISEKHKLRLEAESGHWPNLVHCEELTRDRKGHYYYLGAADDEGRYGIQSFRRR